MEMNIEDMPNFVKVVITGRFVASCSEELKETLGKKIEKCPNILCDLSRMTHIDSSGLGALVYVLQKCKAAGGICRLACLQPHPRIVFDITKVFRVFEIFDSVEEAEASFA
ncbi:MAG: STAS domain-containing protein [Kiritimatiellae bacterium]|nr:STAS domain-containing protein [Kiritimatiellia bacterium]